MSFLAAERLIWLWVALPVIGFYILKARLRKRRVSTLLFWDQIFDEKRQRSLWQNLRHWLSLLLQLIFIAILVTALTDPISSLQQQSGQELILIVDNSASMQAIDIDSGQSRLELAKAEAIKLAQGLRAGDSAAVMTAGSRVHVISGMTDFGPTVTEAVQAITATDGPTNIDQAIQAARRLSPDAERRRVVVLSDACGQTFDQPEADENPSTAAKTQAAGLTETAKDESPEQDVYWVQVGQDSDNVAITIFQARRSTVDPLGYALLVEIRNHSDTKTEGRLKLQLDDDLVDVIPYKLDPDGIFRRTIQATSQSGGILTGSLNSEDGLAVDNVARAIVPKRPTLPVTLVKKADDDCYYLKSVLNSVPLLELYEMSLEDFNAEQGTTNGSKAADTNSARGLTVFNAVVPERIPAGPVLFVGPESNGPIVTIDNGKAPAWTVGDELQSALIAKQADGSPLLMHVKMQNVLVMGARDILVAENWQPATSLLETAEAANVLVSIERESGRILILSSNLDSSDLPLRIAFPVMITNAVNWFLRQSNEIHPAIHTGEKTTIGWDQSEIKDDQELALVRPDGQHHPVAIKNSQIVTDALDAIGVYCLTAAKIKEPIKPISELPESQQQVFQPSVIHDAHSQESQLIAVNLCSAAESDLRLPELPDQSDREIPASGWPPWLWAVLIASGLIVAEWGLFHRRLVA